MMARITAWVEKSLGKRIQGHILNGRSEGVLRVMAVLKTHVTWNAKIKVVTRCAGDEAFLWELCETWLA